MERFAGAVRPMAKRVRQISGVDAAGVWEKVLAALIEQDIVDESTLMLDSTTIKVRQHCSSVKKSSVMRKPGEAGED